jgi:hypothetical protein
MSLKIIKRLAEIAKEEFKDIVTDTEILHAVRLRLELVDGSTVIYSTLCVKNIRSTGAKKIRSLELIQHHIIHK